MNKFKQDGKFCNEDCKRMSDMDIPLDKGEWLELAHFLRAISNIKGLTAVQKSDIQIRLINAFREKSFLPDQYETIVEEIEEIRHLQCKEREGSLEEIVAGMSKILSGLTKDMGQLAFKQIKSIKEMNRTSDQLLVNIKSNVPKKQTLSLVENLQNNCKKVMSNVSEMTKTLKEEATFDKLTQLYNRRSFDDYLANQVKLFKKDKRAISLVFIDIDNFKSFNDSYGHLVGDQVISAVSGEIKRNVRIGDHAARYGGDEMAIIFTSLSQDLAVNRSETIRSNIDSHEFVLRGSKNIINISVSIGVAECLHEWDKLPPADIANNLIKNADIALYKAKEEGRNKVIDARNLGMSN